MALIIADRVKETATTTGTGTFTLGGAVTGFRTFNAGIGTGNTTYYCIFLDGTNEFEVGLGTYTAPDQLSRDTVLASSNSGSKVNFSQGIKSVFCTQPSSKAAYLDASGNLSITTSNITEGTNLYYTDARFDTRLATKDTADLSEGTNLYYTDARARAAISVSGNAIAYNSSTGVITANFEESPTFTGNVVVSGNLTVTGTTTWLDSTNTQISDKNIVLNYASGDSSANADGAGITIQDAVDASTDASLTWDTTLDAFKFSNTLHFDDGIQANFGTSSDLQILHDGSHSYIKDVGTGSLRIRGTDLLLESQGGETFLYAANNGAVTLYHDNAAKLATTSTGIDVTGTVVADQIDLGDNEKIRFGASQDLQVYHTGFDSYIDNFTGHLVIRNQANNKDIVIQTDDGSGNLTDYMRFNGTNENINISKNVGIGTSSVQSGTKVAIHDGATSVASSSGRTLQVASDTTPTIGLYLSGSPSTGDTVGNFDFIANNSSGDQFEWTAARIDSYLVDATGGSRRAGMRFYTSDPNGQTNETMRIDNTGNVGIGQSTIIGSSSGRVALTMGGSTSSIITFGNNGTRWGGIYASATDYSIFSDSLMRFEAGGSERMRIDTSGNVGIGTTSPSRTLQVVSTGTTTGGAYVYSNAIHTGSDTHSLLSVRSDNASATGTVVDIRGDGTGDILNVKDGTNSALIVKDGGNVGIGTDSPSAKLESYVSGNFSTTYNDFSGDGLYIQTNGTTGVGEYTAGLSFSRTVANGARAAGIAGVQDGSDADQVGLAFFTHPSTGTAIALQESLRISSDGNVGIGTSSPSVPLHVYRTGNADLYLERASGARVFGQAQASAGVLGTNTNHRLDIKTNGTTRMTITNIGDVGIGTTAPNARFEVNENPTFNNIDTFGQFVIKTHSGSSGDMLNFGVDYANSLAFIQANERGIGTIPLVLQRYGGNVGIGTDSPNGKLDVAAPQVTTNQFTSPHLRLRATGTADNTGFTGVAYSVSTVDNYGWTVGAVRGSGSGNNSDFVFNIHNNSASGSEKMRIDGGTGNVGIGTSSPSAKLDVAGGIKASGDLVVSSTNLFVDVSTDRVGMGTSSPTRPLHVKDSNDVVAFFESTDSTAVVHIKDQNTGVSIGSDSSGNGQFSADIDQVGSKNILFKLAGSEKVRIDSSGNVGIGTTSPSAKLDVAAGNITAGVKGVEISGNTSYIADGSHGTSLDISHTYGSNDGSFRAINIDLTDSGTNNQTLYGLYVNAQANYLSGNLGIGTTSPLDKLTVNGNLSIFDNKLYNGSASNSAGLDFGGSFVKLHGYNGIVFYSSTAGVGSQTERMRITNTGNVGIGTTSPSELLHISGTNSALRIDGGTSYTNTSEIILSNGRTKIDSEIIDGTAQGDTAIKFSNRVSGTLAERMRINHFGKVGIGTTSPSEKLHVSGAASTYIRAERTVSGSEGYILLGAATNQNQIISRDGAGSNKDLTFLIGTSERMRIDSSGNLLVGKTSADLAVAGIELTASNFANFTRDGGLSAQFNRLTSDGAVVGFLRTGTTVGSISVTGSATAYNTSSDARLKDDIGDFDGLGIVEQLNPRKFAWKADGQEDIGLYAQEVKELVPNAVSETEDGYYQMDYSKLVTPLIKAVQELTAKVESLEAQLANK